MMCKIVLGTIGIRPNNVVFCLCNNTDLPHNGGIGVKCFFNERLMEIETHPHGRIGSGIRHLCIAVHIGLVCHCRIVYQGGRDRHERIGGGQGGNGEYEISVCMVDTSRSRKACALRRE